jgi:hypothetical protein
MCFLLLCQRLDVSCLTHDHGADVTKGVRLSAVHSLLCIDHELDLTVNAGIECPGFYLIFEKASNIVSTVRNSANLYRRLRDEQVCLFLPLFVLRLSFYLFVQLYWWTWESTPMRTLQQFIKVRWQIKHGMIQSLFANKSNIRAMCASDDEECKALHHKDLSDDEWKLWRLFSICSF